MCNRMICHQKTTIEILDINVIRQVINEGPQEIALFGKALFGVFAHSDFTGQLLVGVYQFACAFPYPAFQFGVGLPEVFI